MSGRQETTDARRSLPVSVSAAKHTTRQVSIMNNEIDKEPAGSSAHKLALEVAMEDILDRVRRGDIVSISATVVYCDGSSGTIAIKEGPVDLMTAR